MKRLMATALVAAMGLTMLGGCGVSKDDTTEIQASKTDKTETDKNKEVKLRVWSSASDMDLTNQMIDSFKAA
ncbi:maltose ABC transporter substrate-binding protein, partial [[Eubacterium] rectale]|nr:maltose ABC transporter substrate-binding protein [Agathobacter rectalis]